MTRSTVLPAVALLLSSCGPKTLTLPDDPVERAATCGVVAANSARGATADIKAPLPFEEIGRVMHFLLLASSTGKGFSSETAKQVQTRMTALQDEIAEGKWRDLIPACRAAYPEAYATEVKLPADRFDAQLGCYELADFLRSALQDQGKYDNEIAEYGALKLKLDPVIGPGMRARAGAELADQQQERQEALAAMAKAGSPVLVMRQCNARFG